MSERTAAVVGSVVTIMAAYVFVRGLVMIAAYTHPDSLTAHAAMNLIGSNPNPGN